jgi:hypothetical protein
MITATRTRDLRNVMSASLQCCYSSSPMQQDWRTRHLGLVALLAVLFVLGTLALDFWLDRSLARDRMALATLEREVSALELALAELRASQMGYVVTGQAPDFWMRRSTDLASRMEQSLTRLRESATNDASRTRAAGALGTLSNVLALDRKARDYVAAEQRFLAADVIFIESVEAIDRLTGDLAAIRATEVAAGEAALTRTSGLRLAATGAALVLVLGGAFRIGRPARPSAASEAALTAQMIRDLPPPVKPATPLRPPAPPPPPPAPAVNLPAAAELCVDLARVMDSRDVPALLERAAKVLEAKGVILWMVDPAGAILRPSLSYGYPDKFLARLGTLDVDADNVTSLAFRAVRPQVVAGPNPGAPGAVAVPLVTAAGCNGVLSAELRETKPAPELLALTRIVAAQFATLIAPGDAGAGAPRAAEA